MTDPLRCKTAIVGIGETEFSGDSGRSEQRLAVEAVSAALDDAGLTPDDIEGIVTCDFEDTNQIELVNAMGLRNIHSFTEIGHAGGVPSGAVAHAAMMVASGACKCVVGYRSMNERSGLRYGTRVEGEDNPMAAPRLKRWWGLHIPHGLIVPADWTAMMARRRIIEFGETREQWANIPVTFRKHANQNPHAMQYKKKLTVEDYLNAPLLSDPLCKFDYCLETDGAVAFIVTSAERAKTLKSTPAYIHTAVQAMGTPPVFYLANYYRESMTTSHEIVETAKELWKKSGLNAAHMDVAQIYDHFTPWVLLALEGLGFCKKGEAGAFCADGQLAIGGTLPTNTAGGQMSEGYIHGWSLINEGVKQIRGSSTAQVKDCEFSLVASAAGCPTGAVILSR